MRQRRCAATVSALALGLGFGLGLGAPAFSQDAKPKPAPTRPRPTSSGTGGAGLMEGWKVPPTRPARSAPKAPTAPTDPLARPAPNDPRVRPAQAEPAPASVGALALPTAPSAPLSDASPAAFAAAEAAGQPLGLQIALYGAIRNNPDLIALRNSNIASAEAVEAARHFPVALNPTLWIDYRPITLIPRDPFGGSGTGTGTAAGGKHSGPFYHNGQNYFLFSIRQPLELGHQTTHRHAIAKAALNQQEWTVVQAELLALVQTYRFFQTAAYRREKLRVARELSEFNDRLVVSLKRRLEASQAAAADVVLAEVENQATRQQVDVARQDYANALADLRIQVGLPETAATAEPFGDFVLPTNVPPLEEAALIQMALRSRPEIHAAKALARGALAAVNLARGDRIPTPVVGPQYAIDEAGIQYIGLVLVSQIPVLNNGTPLVRQREADYRRSLMNTAQIEKRTIIQVKAGAAKWNAANRLVNQTAGLSGTLRTQVARMERLFDANQADLTKLLQARQRLIQLENARLDALWQATQAQADLLLALGIPNLIAAANPPAAAAR